VVIEQIFSEGLEKKYSEGLEKKYSEGLEQPVLLKGLYCG